MGLRLDDEISLVEDAPVWVLLAAGETKRLDWAVNAR